METTNEADGRALAASAGMREDGGRDRDIASLAVAPAGAAVAVVVPTTASVGGPPAATKSGPSKRDIERALVGLGLSARRAKKFVVRGWPAISTEETEEAELIEQLEALTARYRSVR